MSVKFKDEFWEREWNNKIDPHCKACMAKLKEAQTPWRCSKCRGWCSSDDFADSALVHKFSHRMCRQCLADGKPRRCIDCGEEKLYSEFTPSMWEQSRKERRCKQCMGGRVCSVCVGKTLWHRNHFTPDEWNKSDVERKCLKCMTKRCSRCRKDKVRTLFSDTQWKSNELCCLCYDCDRKRCVECNKLRGYKEFENAVWDLPEDSPDAICRICTQGQRQRGFWTCSVQQCRKRKPHSDFSIAIAKHGKTVRGNPRRCNDCICKQEREEAEMNRSSWEQVQKRSKM